MCDGRDPRSWHVQAISEVRIARHDLALVGADRKPVRLENWRDEKHIRALLIRLQPEPAVGFLLQHARRERTKALSELDLQVHRRLHLLRARIAQNAPGTKRPRAEFHPPLE